MLLAAGGGGGGGGDGCGALVDVADAAERCGDD